MMAAALGAGTGLSLPMQARLGQQCGQSCRVSQLAVMQPQARQPWWSAPLHAGLAALQPTCRSKHVLVAIGALVGYRRSKARGPVAAQAQKELIENKNPSGVHCGDKLQVTVKTVSKVGVFCDTTSNVEAFIPTQRLKMAKDMYKEGMQLDVTVFRPALPAGTKTEVMATDQDLKLLESLHTGLVVEGKVFKVSDTSLLLDIGFPKMAKCWRRHLTTDMRNVRLGDRVSGLKVTRIHRTSVDVVAQRLKMRPLESFKVGERIEGFVTRISSSLNAAFFDIGGTNTVAAFGQSGGLAKNVQAYAPGEKTMLEVVKVAKGKVWVKDLGKQA